MDGRLNCVRRLPARCHPWIDRSINQAEEDKAPLGQALLQLAHAADEVRPFCSRRQRARASERVAGEGGRALALHLLGRGRGRTVSGSNFFFVS